MRRVLKNDLERGKKEGRGASLDSLSLLLPNHVHILYGKTVERKERTIGKNLNEGKVNQNRDERNWEYSRIVVLSSRLEV